MRSDENNALVRHLSLSLSLGRDRELQSCSSSGADAALRLTSFQTTLKQVDRNDDDDVEVDVEAV